jgi:hypothetical protein
MGRELQMLIGGAVVVGKSLVRRGDSVYVVSGTEDIPVYAFRLDRNLMELLAENREVWDGRQSE